MRIVYLLPGLGPCGGVRVACEHLGRLAERGHTVGLAAPKYMIDRFHRGNNDLGWIRLHRKVILAPVGSVSDAKSFDAVVATAFNTVHLASQIPGRAHYYFVQMMEYKFSEPGTHNWKVARESYPFARDQRFQVITIARWLQETMRSEWDLDSVVVPNGVNKADFFPEGSNEHAIVIEGDARNPAKDVDRISWRVGEALREEFGVKLWGYAAYRHNQAGVFDEFYQQPSTAQMRGIYSKAKFILKASKYEGRACAPVEAMCCGTPSVRAIVSGDDDLVDGENCLRTGYDYDDLLEAGRRALSDKALLDDLTAGAEKYAKEHLNWEDKVDRLEDIYEGMG